MSERERETSRPSTCRAKKKEPNRTESFAALLCPPIPLPAALRDRIEYPEETCESICAPTFLQGPYTASNKLDAAQNAAPCILSSATTPQPVSPSLSKKKKLSLSLSKYHKQLPRPSICRAFLPRQKLDSSKEDLEPIEASLLALSARAASLDETLRLLSLRARAARGAREAQRGAASTLVRACEAARGEWRAEAQRVAEHEAFAARDRAAEAEAEALRCALAAASVAAAGAAAALTAADARADGLRRQLAEFELGEEEEEEEEEEDVSAAVGATFRALAEAVEASSR